MSASADTKIGYVQLDKIMQSPQSLDAGKKLQSEFSPRSTDLNNLKKQLDDKQAAFDKDSAKLSDADRSKRSKELSDMQIDLQRKQRELSEDFNLRESELKTNLQDRINKAVTAVSVNEGYDLVLYGNAAYAGKKVDITDKVLKELSK
ncbi:MAG TPA: OmpH family outer membrane protein [Methylophilaceae bacterium]|jgi:outer membrane protein